MLYSRFSLVICFLHSSVYVQEVILGKQLILLFIEFLIISPGFCHCFGAPMLKVLIHLGSACPPSGHSVELLIW